MDQEAPGKAVVITGASTGIGRACALRLDGLGMRVFAGVRRQADGEALRRAASNRLTPLYLDVTEPDAIAAAAETVNTALQPAGLAGLVNNAGIPVGGPVEFQDLDDLRRALEVNLVGAVAVTQAFLPLLRRAQGRIANISSVSGLVSLPFGGPYSATKFALEAITDALRVELRPWHIWVASVEPGDIYTPIWEKSLALLDRMAQNLPPQAHELYGPAFVLRERFRPHGIPPEQVARAVEHALLARRPRARYLVGVDARLLILLQHLPVRLRDWLIAQQLPKYG